MEDSEELMASKADADANREKLHSRVSYTNVVFLCAELCSEENGQFFMFIRSIRFLFSDRRTAE